MKIKEKDNSAPYEKLMKSKIFFIFLIPIFLALLIGIFQQLYYRYQVKKTLNDLNGEVVNLKNQKDDLSNLINSYKNESNLEKEARVRLNLKKEGEKVVIILPTATSTVEDGEAVLMSSDEIKNLPNYKQWWYYFFGKRLK
ncbi:septum formation initiator family protein [Candidatus Wolfebacteria bacterium]|nr:septum formation initiator family protein [Candidatus Wolfebacteria bacterium]